MYGAIEAGGTKFVCAIGSDDLEVVEKVSFPTTTPDETLMKTFDFFDRFDLKAIGVGSFGPIDLNPKSSTYGYIKNTPKLAWENFNLLGEIRKRYNVPAGWTTDVNSAALGEANKGAGCGLNNVLYLTVGTGIGGGAIVKGEILEGFSHPEMGHIQVRRHPLDHFAGLCPYHGDCLEGMASGPTIEARLRKKGDEIGQDNEVWDFLADYLAQAVFNYSMTLRPEIVILGGGVMKSPVLLSKIKKRLPEFIASYVEIPQVDHYLVHPKLGDDAGIVGGFVLAEKVLEEKRR